MKFYDDPTQVKFYDVHSKHYTGGIACGGYIICGCCGGIIAITAILKHAPEGIEPIIDLKWIDISNEIAGEVI